MNNINTLFKYSFVDLIALILTFSLLGRIRDADVLGYIPIVGIKSNKYTT